MYFYEVCYVKQKVQKTLGPVKEVSTLFGFGVSPTHSSEAHQDISVPLFYTIPKGILCELTPAGSAYSGREGSRASPSLQMCCSQGRQGQQHTDMEYQPS